MAKAKTYPGFKTPRINQDIKNYKPQTGWRGWLFRFITIPRYIELPPTKKWKL